VTINHLCVISHKHTSGEFFHSNDEFQWDSTQTFENVLFLFVYLFNCLFIYSYVHTLFAPSPVCPHPFPISPNPLASRQNLFCLLLQFCWRENIRDNKKDIAFLLAWDKDSYTERFLAHVYYNLNWFISTRPLQYFPVTFT
jgi:hypothetical protein